MGGENRGSLFHLPPSKGGAVCTEITDTMAAQRGGCSGLAGCAGLAILLIALSQSRRTSVPTIPCTPVTRGTSAMTEGLSSIWKRI